MTTRILKLEDEDVELIGKLVTNIHRRLQNNPSDPSVGEFLSSAHRLFKQFEEGLPTETQFLRGIKASEMLAEEVLIQKQEKKRSKLAEKGISFGASEGELVEPVKKKVRKAPTKPPKPKEVSPCSEHNNTGARAPRGDCKGCWNYYRHLHPDRYDAAWSKHKQKRKK